MVYIDEQRCIGCGTCVSVCPSGFELIEGKAKVKDETADCIQDAVIACPRGAITT
ncbi:MAG: ferredoxin [Candidatus Hydrogenedentota bacterium]